MKKLLKRIGYILLVLTTIYTIVSVSILHSVDVYRTNILVGKVLSLSWQIVAVVMGILWLITLRGFVKWIKKQFNKDTINNILPEGAELTEDGKIQTATPTMPLEENQEPKITVKSEKKREKTWKNKFQSLSSVDIEEKINPAQPVCDGETEILPEEEGLEGTEILLEEEEDVEGTEILLEEEEGLEGTEILLEEGLESIEILPEEKEELVFKFCPQCGQTLKQGQKFCSKCGKKIGV